MQLMANPSQEVVAESVVVIKKLLQLNAKKLPGPDAEETQEVRQSSCCMSNEFRKAFVIKKLSGSLPVC